MLANGNTLCLKAYMEVLFGYQIAMIYSLFGKEKKNYVTHLSEVLNSADSHRGQ